MQDIVDKGEASALLSYTHYASGDKGYFVLDYLNRDGIQIGSSVPLPDTSYAGTVEGNDFEKIAPMPAQTRKVRIRAVYERVGGTRNDFYPVYPSLMIKATKNP